MLKYWLWLTQIPGLSTQSRLALLRHFETPEEIFYADAEEIRLTEGLPRQQADLLEDRALDRAERILEDCQKLGHQILTIQDAAYPGRLKNIYDPPLLLYVRGRLPVIDEEAVISAVGTRSCTPYGVKCAEKLGAGLAACGAVVCSGLARGIDTAAIRGALRGGGQVIGVLGNGLDVAYPSENRYLYEDVASAGALISEYPPGTAPVGRHFPIRNRIISGLAVAVLVVEAPPRSGALITAETALEQGRDVFAVPGPIDAESSVGCNRLIRDGAGVASEAWDLLREYEARFLDRIHPEGAARRIRALGYQARQKKEAKPAPTEPAVLPLPTRPADEFSPLQRTLLTLLTEEPVQVDDLIEASGLPTRQVLSALTILELDHLVRQHSGKRYTRTVTLTE